MASFDVAVIGAGCIGASTAKHLAEAGHSVVVVEKEEGPARHQSGRNSGVIHAGYNPAPGTAKARYCIKGNRTMRAYCRDRGVGLDEGGILVVATGEDEMERLRELEQRGRANGAAVRLVDETGIHDLEPHAAGVVALHAPEGASVDSRAYVQALLDDAVAAGAQTRYGVHVTAITADGIQTRDGALPARVVVNAAGLWADRLAGADDLRVLPFRGAYATLLAPADRWVRSHLYAVPDPAFPFLGVHLSRRVDGTVTAGPTAMPAAGRAAYRVWQGSPRDAFSAATWPGAWRLGLRRDFLSQVPGEAAKALSLRAVWREARRLLPALRPRDLQRAPHLAGIRAQLVDRSGRLVEDIVVRETETAVHVLNAVSPGLTCSLPFGEDLARRAVGKL